jgi:single-stranded DNA-binding protein
MGGRAVRLGLFSPLPPKEEGMQAINMMVGRLGAEPEPKLTKNQLPYCVLSVAESRNVKRDNNWERFCVWHQLKVWGNMVGPVRRLLRKGRLCLFHYRVDYQRETVRGKDKDFEMEIPSFTVTSFEPLANYGAQQQN